jgi:hypothetical protein
MSFAYMHNLLKRCGRCRVLPGYTAASCSVQLPISRWCSVQSPNALQTDTPHEHCVECDPPALCNWCKICCSIYKSAEASTPTGPVVTPPQSHATPKIGRRLGLPLQKRSTTGETGWTQQLLACYTVGPRPKHVLQVRRASTSPTVL